MSKSSEKAAETMKAKLLELIKAHPGMAATDAPPHLRRFFRPLSREEDKIEYKDGWYIKAKRSVGPRFPLKLVGENGNAFVILGLFQRGAKAAGWTPEQIENARNEMTSGDYNNLLCKAMEFADVE